MDDDVLRGSAVTDSWVPAVDGCLSNPAACSHGSSITCPSVCSANPWGSRRLLPCPLHVGAPRHPASGPSGPDSCVLRDSPTPRRVPLGAEWRAAAGAVRGVLAHVVVLVWGAVRSACCVETRRVARGDGRRRPGAVAVTPHHGAVAMAPPPVAPLRERQR